MLTQGCVWLHKLADDSPLMFWWYRRYKRQKCIADKQHYFYFTVLSILYNNYMFLYTYSNKFIFFIKFKLLAILLLKLECILRYTEFITFKVSPINMFSLP